MFERRCQTAMSAGDRALTTRMAAISGLGQRRISHAARIATAIHMIWKYLFMSNSTALTTTTLGTMKSATIQATRNHRFGRAACREGGHDREDERDAEVGQVEEGDRLRPVTEARLAPAGDEPERTDLALGRTADAMNGAARMTGARNSTASRTTVRRAPGTARHDVQEHDQVRRREREELERRKERGKDPGQQDPERPAPEAGHHQQHDRHQPRQAQGSSPGAAGTRSRRSMRS